MNTLAPVTPFKPISDAHLFTDCCHCIRLYHMILAGRASWPVNNGIHSERMVFQEGQLGRWGGGFDC